MDLYVLMVGKMVLAVEDVLILMTVLMILVLLVVTVLGGDFWSRAVKYKGGIR